ncbi:MAG: winged helix-turn-helix transcriptional regulator [Thaumarchaeota archaeon]|nr:winged helix-turn-helix transcriptional regulator [Nitrososphaerota archaeon]
MPRALSGIDRKILAILLEADRRVSSSEMSKRLGIPMSTVQRRRKQLEKEYIIANYSLNSKNFGWRTVDLLIATERGATLQVGKELLKRRDVSSVASMLGEHAINLRAEALVMSNTELLRLLEAVKAIDGVRDVLWCEVVETIGKNSLGTLLAQ